MIRSHSAAVRRAETSRDARTCLSTAHPTAQQNGSRLTDDFSTATEHTDVDVIYLQSLASRHLRSSEIRFESKVMGRLENFRIGRACPLLVVVKRLKPLTALSGTVDRLASSMSDHTPVLFNVFEDWNDESVVPHISFDSIR